MKLTIWQAFEQNGKRRLVAKTKKDLIKKIASRCSDTHVVREWHVWKAHISPNSDWVNSVIELLGSNLTGENTKLLGREYIIPDESSRSNCFFARSKCIEDIAAAPIASSSETSDSNP